MDISKDTIAVIGAGIGALPILQKAREIKVRTIAFGSADSLAREYADVFIETDIFDTDYIISECKKNNVKGVLASSSIITGPDLVTIIST